MITELREILKGIDKDDGNEAWWETSKGVEFGAKKLKEVEELVKKLTILVVRESFPSDLVKLINQFIEDGDKFESREVYGRYSEIFVSRKELDAVHKRELR